MKKSWFLVVLSLLFSLCFKSTTVGAANVIGHSPVIYSTEGQIGAITLYDDYVLRVEYKYSASNVQIRICPTDNCVDGLTQSYTSPENFFDGDHVDLYLKDLFVLTDGTKYNIVMSASFKPYASAITVVSTGGLSEEFVYVEENASDESDNKDDKLEEVLTRSQKIEKILRTYVIPGLYAILLIVLIIKGILLGIDIAKHADQPEVRGEKIRAFSYFGVAIVLLLLLNTIAGFVTGLFG